MLAPPLRMLDWYGPMSVRLTSDDATGALLEDRIMVKTAQVGVVSRSSAHK